MFGSSWSSFEEDPFFSDSFSSHNENMRQMMKSFAQPFGQLLSVAGGRGRREDDEDDDKVSCSARSHALAPFGTFGGPSSLVPFGSFGAMNADVSPFQAMDRMMSHMRHNMQDLQRRFSDMSVDPEGHSFCSSSIMTFSKVGNEPPKVFQASSQTRRAPGGIKETRKSMRDSDSGIEKMAVGHHIYDRAHVIKGLKNNKTGDQELNQEFINMRESDARDFNDEWQNQILKFIHSGKRNLESSRLINGHSDSSVNYEDISKRERPRQRSSIESQRRPRAFEGNLRIKGSSVKSSKK
ncbi:myeloid leukemia factor 1 isoform X1 [Vombatus ursinus]|uniref:Myeloid leukemia factor 1 n=1 Tax=Vombatus ursinus TaxID=29139 RepID=A0A4X2LIC7_VOMUR|nr:myeloid leukemia factor 1 isoform X1 [Vombatus ursinus]